MSGRKIAAATVQNRTQTPFWNYVKEKLLAAHRQPITPPPGIAGEDGKCVYQNPLRFPKTQSARPGSAELPTLPGGVHHKLADNYYLTRDGRRTVEPPAALYASDGHVKQYGTQTGEAVQREQAIQVNAGPESNFGLAAPTPGFGATWARNKEFELDSQKNDPSFEYFQRFDKYAKSK
ncbi:unnamed protein product [Caenorhabditis angaria]|uniref:NADH dehydrogenase [ubiquinone] 1 alpha subcomplex subunit 7 n=1 Tax=Caenorhabditis angaria TaxID=860376 RepID=A0A9P1ICW0_9PELO|nr:unnamed protein product [Caenorhabditis angaria]